MALNNPLKNKLIEAIIQQESGGDPNAVSPAGAQGLMQVMPATAKQPGFGIEPLKDPFDPKENKRFGTEYFDAMLRRYNDDIETALVAYNWGVGNADKWLKGGKDDTKLPEETRNYKNIIMENAELGKNMTPPSTRSPEELSELKKKIKETKSPGTPSVPSDTRYLSLHQDPTQGLKVPKPPGSQVTQPDMQEVFVEDTGEILEFPKDMNEYQMEVAIRDYLMSKGIDASRPGGLGAALERGVDTLQQAAYGTVYGLTGDEDARKAMLAKAGEVRQTDLVQFSDLFDNEGFIKNSLDTVEFLGEQISLQAPIIGSMAAGAYAGAKVGSLGGPWGAAAGGALGALGTSFGLHFGLFTSRQVEESEDKLNPEKLDPERAAMNAAGAASLDAVGAYFLWPFRNIIKFNTMPKNFSTKLSTNFARAAAMEGSTESVQQLLERNAVEGLALWDEEALSEYAHAALLGGILGGTLGAVGTLSAKAHEEISKRKGATLDAHSSEISKRTKGPVVDMDKVPLEDLFKDEGPHSAEEIATKVFEVNTKEFSDPKKARKYLEDEGAAEELFGDNVDLATIEDPIVQAAAVAWKSRQQGVDLSQVIPSKHMKMTNAKKFLIDQGFDPYTVAFLSQKIASRIAKDFEGKPLGQLELNKENGRVEENYVPDVEEAPRTPHSILTQQELQALRVHQAEMDQEIRGEMTRRKVRESLRAKYGGDKFTDYDLRFDDIKAKEKQFVKAHKEDLGVTEEQIENATEQELHDLVQRVPEKSDDVRKFKKNINARRQRLPKDMWAQDTKGRGPTRATLTPEGLQAFNDIRGIETMDIPSLRSIFESLRTGTRIPVTPVDKRPLAVHPEIDEKVVKKLRSLGYPKESAEAIGVLYSAFYDTMGRRAGLSVDEFMQKYPLPKISKSAKKPKGSLWTLLQAAWHGSPHVFERFSLKSIGTGEGHQMFGWGLYFSELKNIASHYRRQETLKRRDIKIKGESSRDFVKKRVDKALENYHKRIEELKKTVPEKNWEDPEAVEFWELQVEDKELDVRFSIDNHIEVLFDTVENFKTKEAARKAWKEYVEKHKKIKQDQLENQYKRGAFVVRLTQRAFYETILEELNILEKLPMPEIVQPEGRLYRVRIPENEDLLNWEEPISKQSPRVKRKIKDLLKIIRRKKLFRGDVVLSSNQKQIWDVIEKETGENLGSVQKLTSGKFQASPVYGEETVHNTLDQAADKIRNEENKERTKDLKGRQFYFRLSTAFGSDRDASLALARKGVPGHRYHTGVSRHKKGKKTYNYVIYDDSVIDVESYEQQGRGGIDFMASGEAMIRLFETADKSTMLHESGHFFLKVLQDMANHGIVEAERELNTVRSWWDKNASRVALDAQKVHSDPVTANDVRRALRDGTTGDVALDKAINTGMHEQWARAFERYLRDGKAPSPELQSIFDKFKEWLKQVYKRIKDLNVTLSPEIKDVFDRMLAEESKPVVQRTQGKEFLPDTMKSFLNVLETLSDPQVRNHRNTLDMLNTLNSALNPRDTLSLMEFFRFANTKSDLVSQSDKATLKKHGTKIKENLEESLGIPSYDLEYLDQSELEATAFSEYMDGTGNYNPEVNKVFKKLKDTLERLRNTLNDKEIQDLNDVFKNSEYPVKAQQRALRRYQERLFPLARVKKDIDTMLDLATQEPGDVDLGDANKHWGFRVTRTLSSMPGTAARDRNTAKIVEMQKRLEDMQTKFMNLFGRQLDNLITKNPDHFDAASELLMHLRTTGQDLEFDNQGRILYTKDGKDYAASPAVSRMAQRLTNLYKEVLRGYIGVTENAMKNTKEFGFHPDMDITLTEISKKIEQFKEQAKEVPGGLKKQLNGLVDDLESLRDMRRQAEVHLDPRKSYIPEMRFGSYGIKVTMTDPKTKETKDLGFYAVESEALGDRISKSSLRETMDRIKETHGDNVTVSEPFMMTYDELANEQNSAYLTQELMAAMVSQRDPGSAKALSSMYQAQKKRSANKGLARHLLHTNHVPGYSTDWKRVATQYLSGSSVHLSRMSFNPHFKNFEHQVKLKIGGNTEYGKYLLDYMDYMQSPANDMAKMRMFNFMWGLGFNMSTAVLQLMNLGIQVPAYMMQYRAAPVKNLGVIRRNGTLAAKILGYGYGTQAAKRGAPIGAVKKSLNPQSIRKFIKDPELAKFIEDNIDFLQNNILGDMVDFRKFDPGSKHGRINAGMNDLATRMGAPIDMTERMSRLTTLLSLYETLSDPVSRSRMNNVLSNDMGYLEWRAQNPRFTDQQAMALYGVQETHGLYGKAGRGRTQRGILGTMVFPFMTHPIQMMELMWRQAKPAKYGGRGGKGGALAFAYTLGAYAVLGGLAGIPGAELWKEFWEYIRKLDGEQSIAEWDLRNAVYDVLTANGVNEDSARIAARTADKGILSLTGVDIAQRVGVPFYWQDVVVQLMSERPDFGRTMGIVGTNLLRGGRQSLEDYRTHGTVNLTPVAPVALRNILQGIHWSSYGASTSYGRPLLAEPGAKYTDRTLSGSDIWKRAFGFQPLSVAEARLENTVENILRSPYAPKFNSFRRRLAKIEERLLQSQDESEKQRLRRKRDETWDEINAFVEEHNVPVTLEFYRGIHRSVNDHVQRVMRPGDIPRSRQTQYLRNIEERKRELFRGG